MRHLFLTVILFASLAASAYDAILDTYIPAIDKNYVVDMTYYAIITDADGNVKYSIWLLTPERMAAPEHSRKGLYFVGVYGPNPQNYKGSGYEKGHLCPAEDMRWSLEAMKSTFDTINAVPQTLKLNRGVWKSLETYCRKRAADGRVLVIMAGPLYLGRPPPTIGRDAVSVPSHCYKTVIDTVSSERQTYIMPNTANITGCYTDFSAE